MNFMTSKNFWLVTAGNFFFHLTFTSFFLLPLYIHSLGGDETEIGLIMGCFGLTAMFIIPWAGRLMDRYGRKRFLLYGILLMLASSVPYGLIRGYHPVLFGILRALQGVSFAFAFIAANTVVVDTAGPNQRARAIGFFGVFTLVTHAIGPLIAEGVAREIGFRIALLLSTGWSVFGLFCIGPIREDPPSEAGLDSPVATAPEREMRLRVPLLTTLLTGGSFVAVLIFTPTFMEGAGIRPVSLFFVGYTVAAVAVRLGLSGLSDRVGRNRTITIFLSLFCASILGLAFVPLAKVGALPALLAVALTFGASHGMLYPTLSALVVDLMPDAQKGRAIGYYSGAFNVGATLAAFAFGPILKAYGYTVLFLCVAACSALGLLVFYARNPR